MILFDVFVFVLVLSCVCHCKYQILRSLRLHHPDSIPVSQEYIYQVPGVKFFGTDVSYFVRPLLFIDEQETPLLT